MNSNRINVLGQNVVNTLENLIKNEVQDVDESFFYLKAVIQNFKAKICKVNHLKYWNELLTIQMTSLEKLFIEEPEIISPNLSPVLPSEKNERLLKVFTPIVDKKSKIKCSVKTCKKTFARRATYFAHMDTKHLGEKKRYCSQDPQGTCRLISRVTKRECGAKLPLKEVKTLNNIKLDWVKLGHFEALYY